MNQRIKKEERNFHYKNERNLQLCRETQLCHERQFKGYQSFNFFALIDNNDLLMVHFYDQNWNDNYKVELFEIPA